MPDVRIDAERQTPPEIRHRRRARIWAVSGAILGVACVVSGSSVLAPDNPDDERTWYHACKLDAIREAKTPEALSALMRACEHQSRERFVRARLRMVPAKCKDESPDAPEIARRKTSAEERRRSVFLGEEEIIYGRSPREACVAACAKSGWWSRTVGECSKPIGSN